MRLVPAVASLLLCLAFVPRPASSSDVDAASGPISFTNDIVPVLSKYGCNSGGCHGKAIGQNGFKLSLYGFDPAFDYAAIVHESRGRRLTVAAPSESLLLLKATGEIAHGGGVRLTPDSDPYRLLVRWIAQAAPWGTDGEPRLTQIEVAPTQTLVSGPHAEQLRVTAFYSDGASRDVTALARYDSQTPELLEVSATGRVQTGGRSGEGLVMIRYQDAVASARFTQPFGAALPESEYAGFEPKNWIDEMVLAKWRSLGIAPSPEADDAAFLRRACLDVMGTLPTPDEVREFLNDSSPDKRDKLIDRLLARDEHAVFWSHKWGEVLRVKAKDKSHNDRTRAFTAWLRQAVAGNMPYDQFAREIITVSGKRADHPQMDWYRQAINHQVRVEDTCQVFLGLRVSCANCHNHPFENISQRDYWHFAAFFAKVGSPSYGAVDEIKYNEKGKVENPRTGEEMLPRAFGSDVYEFVEGVDPRQHLMDWMTAPENPYFARAICNRVWGHYMQIGLVDPVDDMRATNPPSNPQLLDALAKFLVENKYDLRLLMRTILTSRVYGLSADPLPANEQDARNYARRYPRRMSPHVLMDAIAFATGSPQEFKDFPEAKRALELPNELYASDFLDMFGRSARDTPCECETSLEPNLSQVLYLLHSEELDRQLSNPKGRIAELVQANAPPAEAVEDLFLRTFSRRPTPEELQDAVAFLENASSPQAGLEDLLWTLLNSKEFLFNH